MLLRDILSFIAVSCIYIYIYIMYLLWERDEQNGRFKIKYQSQETAAFGYRRVSRYWWWRKIEKEKRTCVIMKAKARLYYREQNIDYWRVQCLHVCDLIIDETLSLTHEERYYTPIYFTLNLLLVWKTTKVFCTRSKTPFLWTPSSFELNFTLYCVMLLSIINVTFLKILLVTMLPLLHLFTFITFMLLYHW